MCTEFVLAIIYLLTISTVNFFLFKLLKSYLQGINYSRKFIVNKE